MVSFINSVLEMWGFSFILLFKGSGRSFRKILVCASCKLYWWMVKLVLVLSHLLVNVWES